MALDEDTHLAKEHKFDATVYREIFMYENFRGNFCCYKNIFMAQGTHPPKLFNEKFFLTHECTPTVLATIVVTFRK